jgi:hypothetical protein
MGRQASTLRKMSICRAISSLCPGKRKRTIRTDILAYKKYTIPLDG